MPSSNVPYFSAFTGLLRRTGRTCGPGTPRCRFCPAARSPGALRGAVTLEFILCLPVLVIVTLAAVQYGTAMVLRQALEHSATVGAREAGKGAALADVVAAVQTMLAPHNLVISNVAGSGVRVRFEDGLNPPQLFGDPTLTCNAPPPVLVAGEARVTVALNLTTTPLSNWLNYFGVDFTSRRFEASTLVRKE